MMYDQMVGRVNAYITVTPALDGEVVMRCRCGYVLGPAARGYKGLSREARYPVQHVGPYANPYRLGDGRFELREYYCPSCFVLYETEVALESDPVLEDIELDLSAHSVEGGSDDGSPRAE